MYGFVSARGGENAILFYLASKSVTYVTAWGLIWDGTFSAARNL